MNGKKHKQLLISSRWERAQSFLELAIVIPILLLLVLGVVEVSLIMGVYLDMLDLTRGAARFASTRDPFAPPPATYSCDPDNFDFYYSTSCYIAPVNPSLVFDPARDDVVISVYSVNAHAVSHSYPVSGPWSLTSNWNKDCEGNVVLTEPYVTTAQIDSMLLSTAPSKEGFVAVELFYCYDLSLNVPILTSYIPNPLRLHAYTIMPLPKAQ